MGRVGGWVMGGWLWMGGVGGWEGGLLTVLDAPLLGHGGLGVLLEEGLVEDAFCVFCFD